MYSLKENFKELTVQDNVDFLWSAKEPLGTECQKKVYNETNEMTFLFDFNIDTQPDHDNTLVPVKNISRIIGNKSYNIITTDRSLKR